MQTFLLNLAALFSFLGEHIVTVAVAVVVAVVGRYLDLRYQSKLRMQESHWERVQGVLAQALSAYRACQRLVTQSDATADEDSAEFSKAWLDFDVAVLNLEGYVGPLEVLKDFQQAFTDTANYARARNSARKEMDAGRNGEQTSRFYTDWQQTAWRQLEQLRNRIPELVREVNERKPMGRPRKG